MNSEPHLPADTLEFAHRMFNAARNGDPTTLIPAINAGLPVNLTNDKGKYGTTPGAAHPRYDSSMHSFIDENPPKETPF
jgi:hypothetical protein